MTTGMGQGGKVCFCHRCSSHLCCRASPQCQRRRGGHVEGLIDILMLFVGSKELLACNLFRILITFQCCLLVLPSYCIDVSTCIMLLKMLCRYQRNRRFYSETCVKASSEVRARKYYKIHSVLLSNMVDLALKTLFKKIEKFYQVTNKLQENYVIIDIMWYVRMICKRSLFNNILVFSYVGQLFLIRYKEADNR